MDALLKLLRTYRVTAGLADRLHIAEDVFRLVEPQLRVFVFGSVSAAASDDVLQEILKAIATDLAKFKGDTEPQFWAWCYRLSRNKLSDHFRKETASRVLSLPDEALCQLVEASAQIEPISSADRLDLTYAMRLLRDAKPECFELLWNHYVIGLDYAEIAEAQNNNYDAVRIRVRRCLDTAQSLIS